LSRQFTFICLIKVLSTKHHRKNCTFRIVVTPKTSKLLNRSALHEVFYLSKGVKLVPNFNVSFFFRGFRLHDEASRRNSQRRPLLTDVERRRSLRRHLVCRFHRRKAPAFLPKKVDAGNGADPDADDDDYADADADADNERNQRLLQ